MSESIRVLWTVIASAHEIATSCRGFYGIICIEHNFIYEQTNSEKKKIQLQKKAISTQFVVIEFKFASRFLVEFSIEKMLAKEVRDCCAKPDGLKWSERNLIFHFFASFRVWTKAFLPLLIHQMEKQHIYIAVGIGLENLFSFQAVKLQICFLCNLIWTLLGKRNFYDSWTSSNITLSSSFEMLRWGWRFSFLPKAFN